MSSVDDRIVNMKFNSKELTTGAAESKKSLSDLEGQLQKTAKSDGLGTMGKNVEQVTGRFSAMRIAGITAVATIANKAVNAGLQLLKSFTLDPIMDGFNEYQTNLKSIQTITANTGAGLPKVNAALKELNDFSDQTIYNFSEMARNIGTFTAAGVQLKPAVSAIKGIANLAALSGSNSQQASTAMYQLSQAIAAGRVNLQDWNSVVNAGMGGKQFQTALTQSAIAMGKINRSAVEFDKQMKVSKISGEAFRQSISPQPGKEPWLTSQVLVNTLKVLDGRLSATALTFQRNADGSKKYSDEAAIAAQIDKERVALAKEGIKYTDKQFKQLTEMADAAFDSATKIKTVPQLLGVVRESIGSVFANLFTSVFGNLEQASRFLTAVSLQIKGATDFISGALDAVIGKWANTKGSGRGSIFNSILRTMTALGGVLKPLKQAFAEVFPTNAAGILSRITNMIGKFTYSIQPTEKSMDILRRVFAGFFSVIHIGMTVFRAFGALFSGFFGEILKNSGGATSGIGEFLAKIGDLLVKLDDFVTSGNTMVEVFGDIGKAAGNLVGGGLDIAGDLINGLVGGLSAGAILGKLKSVITSMATSIIEWIKGPLGIHSPSTVTQEIGSNLLEGLIIGLKAAIGAVFKLIGAIVDSVLNGFGDLFDGMDSFDFAVVMQAVFSGGLLLVITRFFSAFRGIGSAFTKTLNAMTETLGDMQATLKAEALKAIAIAIGILVASLVVLQFLDQEKLIKGVGAIAALMAVMNATFYAMSKIGSSTNAAGDQIELGAGKIIGMASAMLIMANAMLVLSTAVTLLGNQKLETLAKGIGTVAILLGLMVVSILVFSKIAPLAKGASAALISMSVALLILSAAVLAFGSMDLTTLAKGLGALAIGLGLMVVAALGMSAFGDQAKTGAAAMLIMAAAMLIMAKAVKTLGKLSIAELVKGLGAIVIVMAAMVASLLVLGSQAPLIFIAAQSMALLSAAMLGMAVAIGILGKMDGGELAKGLLAIAAGFVILLAAAAGAIYVAPGLAVLGGTMLALGGGLALAGVGMLAFATGLTLLAAVGGAAISVMTLAINAFIALLPSIAISVAVAFVTFIQTIAAASPKIRDAMAEIMQNMIGTVRDVIPDIRDLLKELIAAAIDVLENSIEKWAKAGLDLIQGLLEELGNHTREIVEAAGRIVTEFIQGMGNNVRDFIFVAADTITNLLLALDLAVQDNVENWTRLGIKIGKDILAGIGSGISGSIGGTIKAAIGGAGGAVLGALGGGGKGGPSQRLLISVPKNIGLTWGQQIVAGMIQGIKDSTNAIRNTIGSLFENVARIGTGGNASLLGQSRGSVLAQRNADVASATATLSRRDADKASNIAGKKKATKAQKKRADQLEAKAKRDEAAAAAAQSKADSQAANLQGNVGIINAIKTRDFDTAGDIYASRAADLSKQAVARLAKAQAEIAKAKTLTGKANAAARKALVNAAAADAKAAADLAKAANDANAAALANYGKGISDRIDAFNQEIADRDWQKIFDESDTATQAAMLQKRADEQAEKSKQAWQAATDARDAAAVAIRTDAAAAGALMDLAEEKAREAAEAGEQAKQDAEAAKNLVDNAANASSSNSTSVITPSRSVLEDASSSVDRYSASLEAATIAAQATQQPVQYVQNNYSPKALSPSEVYRQTNNLLSAASLKKGPS